MIKTNYPIGDFLIRVKNAVMAGNKELTSGSTKLIEALSDLLKKEGYFDTIKNDGENITISLSYKKKRAVISDIRLMSKPGLRVYMKNHELKVYKKPYRLIISTPEGLMFSDEAVKKNLGGEAIAGIL